MNLIDRIVGFHPDLTELRRDIHPELAYQEHRTADIVAAELESYGLARIAHEGDRKRLLLMA